MQRSCALLFPLCKEDNETNLYLFGRCFATINESSIVEFHFWNQVTGYIGTALLNGPIRRAQYQVA